MEKDNAKKLNPLLETLGLLYMAKNFDDAKADMLRSLEEMNIDGNQFYRQQLSYLENYVKEFRSVCALEAEDTFFFGHNTEFFSIIVASATELFESESAEKCLNKQQIFSVISSFLYEGESQEKSNPNTMEGWFAALQSAEYSEDTKWRLLELIHKPEERFRELFAAYERNRDAFTYTYQKNKKQLDKLVDEAPGDISEALRGLAAEFYPQQKKRYLTAVFPLIEWMTPAMIFQGVLADKIDLYRENLENAKETLPQILKLLGDKSKFEILCLLKSHGKYNLEIAEELGLTPATASHHMSMLLSNRMVTVEKKDGRVYYQLNQETLKEIIKCFAEVFL